VVGRICLDCSAVFTGRGSRCGGCISNRGRARNQLRGDRYGAAHKALRAAWSHLVAHGDVVCRRCDLPITLGQSWDLGHPEPGASIGMHPEHAHCNRSAGGKSRR
jgi:ribosomal protein L40E